MSVAVSRRPSIVPVIGTSVPTFTRAAFTATRVNSAGLVELVPADHPRFDYDPVTKALRGVLLEEARTDAALHNRDLTNAAWVKTSTTAAKNATGRDGVASSASTLTASANNGTCLQTVTAASAGKVFSPWVKRKTGAGSVEITVNGGTNWQDITAQLSSSAWYGAAEGRTVTNPQFGFRLGTSGDEIEVDYAGLQDQTTATSAIATAAAAVTRNAGDLSVLSLGTWFNPAESTVFVEWIPGLKADYVPCEFSDGTTNNRFGVYRFSGGPVIRGFNVAAGAIDFDAGTGDVAAATIGRTAAAFKTNDCAVSTNGGTVTADATVSLAAVTQLRLGRSANAGNSDWRLNGHLRKFAYYSSRLSSAELQTLSAGGAIAAAPALAYDFTAEDVAAWGAPHA